MNAHSVYRFWEHAKSGSVFAVRLNDRDQLTGAHGPLFSNQMLSEHLPRFQYDEQPRHLAWMESHRENWAQKEY